MDERAHVNRRKRYPPCPHCGDVGIKHGTTWGGTQRWYCKTCQREYTEKRPRCPYCGGRATKNGTVDGKQAWRCNDCSKQFIAETPVRADLRKKDTFVRTPKFFPDVDAILRYEPPAYCKPGMQCSRCPHLLECGENHGQLLCEGAFAVQVGGEVRVW